MKYKIEIVKEQDADIVITARERTPVLERLEALLTDAEAEPLADAVLYGYRDDEIVRLEPSEVYCFFVEAGRVYALTDGGRWQMRERLYTLEGTVGDGYIKINQSCLIRRDKIARFRTTLGGALEVVLKNGYTDYVSRRQLKSVKERLGI